jgi:hypothetical protein
MAQDEDWKVLDKFSEFEIECMKHFNYPELHDEKFKNTLSDIIENTFPLSPTPVPVPPVTAYSPSLRTPQAVHPHKIQRSGIPCFL